MKALRCLALVALLSLVVPVTVEAGFGGYGFQPYYGGWNSYGGYGGSYYCCYYYRPYCYNYCCYNSGYCYYYNPYTCSYWGRYDYKAKGYSLLSKEHRKANLADIKEEWFPTPGAMPPVPESGDNGPQMAVPPAPPQK
jgi:hypothetical protein